MRPNRSLPVVCTAMLVFAGCVSTELETGANHPANPKVPASSRPESPSPLQSGFDPFSAYESPSPAPHEEDHHAHHGGGTSSAVPAGSSSAHSGHEAPQSAVWTCTMHPEVRKSEPGNCPICGMKLVPAKP